MIMSRVAEQTSTPSQTKQGSKSTKKDAVSVETAADILVSALKMYDNAGGLFDIIPLPEKNGVGVFLGNWKYDPETGDLALSSERKTT